MAGAVLLALLVVAPIINLRVINQAVPPEHNDLISRWAGVRAALHGRDPYSPQVTREIDELADHSPSEAFNYPATLVPLLAPVAWLSWPAFRLLFLLLVTPSLAVGFWLCIPLLRLELRPAQSIAAVLLCLCSWPVVWGLRMQQLTLLIAVFLIFGCYLLTRRHDVSAGILLALATVKPQLAIVLLLWLVLWACTRRAWTLLASFCVTGALLLIASQLLVPGWFPHWLTALHSFQQTYGFLPLDLLFAHRIAVALTAILAAAGGYRLWTMRSCVPDSAEFGHAIALALAITVSVAYATQWMIYNQTLLAPAALLLLLGPGRQGNSMLHWLSAATAVVGIGWGFAALVLSAGAVVFRHSPDLLLLPFHNPYLGPLLTLALLAGPLGPAAKPFASGKKPAPS